MHYTRTLKIVGIYKLKHKKFLNSAHVPLIRRFVYNRATVRGRGEISNEKKPSNYHSDHNKSQQRWSDGSMVRQLDGPTLLHYIEKKWKLHKLMLLESLCTVCISMFPTFKRNLGTSLTSFSFCLKDCRTIELSD